MVPRAGVEPTTLSLGRICSIQLSYRGICKHFTTMNRSEDIYINILIVFRVHDCFGAKVIARNIFFAKP